jgi:ubiquitin C-terminal hydrolase
VLPEVLLVKVNLFASNTSKVKGAGKMKLEKGISVFGVDYRLTGAVMHSGETTAAGHYIALGEFFLSSFNISVGYLSIETIFQQTVFLRA